MEPPSDSTTEPATCGACGEPLAGTQTAVLYRHRVTTKCRNRFALRRELAWIVDYGLGFFLVFGGLVIVSAARQISTDAGALPSTTAPEPSTIEILLIEVLVCIAFVLRDSIAGMSPGKLLMGLQVVDKDSGAPIGARQSFQRDLIVLVPLAMCILPFVMRDGPRPGDGWANTRVIDRRRAGAPAFLGELVARSGWDLSSSKGWH